MLDGGFRAWSSATRPVQRSSEPRPVTDYPVPGIDRDLVCNRADIEAVLASSGSAQIVDCRSAARYRGEVDEPRPGLRRGHIEGSVNLPYADLTDPATGLLHQPARLRVLLAERGIDVSHRIVALCGSGTSSCVLALAVEVIREADPAGIGPPVAIYDGSWSEWGRG